MMKILCVALVFFVAVRAQSDGRYRPANDGAYRPSPGGSGQYNNNDGRYVHDDVKYKHIIGGEGGGGGFGSGGGAGAGGGGGGGAPAYVNIAPKKPTVSVTQRTIVSAPQQPPTGWKVIRWDKDIDTSGYHYLYETENKILGEESGRVQPLSTGEGLRTNGFYEYIGDDGLKYRVDYTADENGFVPQAAHLPQAPPTPPAIVKLLKYLATAPPRTK